MKISKTLALAFIVTLSIGFTACHDNEPETPADELKNDIVGVWECNNSTKAEHYTLDIKLNGTFSGSYSYQYSYMDSPSIFYENGTWKYNSNSGSWYLSGDRYCSGTYLIINNQLIGFSRNIVFTRVDSTEQDDPELAKLYGTWKGEIGGSLFILTFNKDGKMSENVDGKNVGSINFTFKNGILTYDQNSVLANILGTRIELNFVNNKTIKIKDTVFPDEVYTLTKQ